MADLRYWLRLEDIPAGVPFENFNEYWYVWTETENDTRVLCLWDGRRAGNSVNAEGIEYTNPYLELPPNPWTVAEKIAQFVHDRLGVSQTAVDFIRLHDWEAKDWDNIDFYG